MEFSSNDLLFLKSRVVKMNKNGGSKLQKRRTKRAIWIGGLYKIDKNTCLKLSKQTKIKKVKKTR